MRALTCLYGSRGGAGGIKPEPWNPLPETLSEALNSSAAVILAGFIRCGACKGPVVSYTGRRYRCQKAKGSPLVPRRCQSPVYGQDLMDAAVWDKVRGAVSDPRVVMGLLAQEPSLGADLTGAEICRLVSDHIDEVSIQERRKVLRIFGVRVELDGEAVEVRVQV